MKKVILFTARSGFPNGYGAASIIRKYSKGFIKLGYTSTVLLLRPSESNKDIEVLNTNIKGQFEGVEYEYMSKTNFTSNNVIIRHILYSFALLRSIKFIVFNKKNIERVFFYSPDFLLSTFFIQLICKLSNLEIIGIKTESSFSDIQRTKKLYWKTREKYIYRQFSSMIVITNYLKDQIRLFGFNKNVEVLPIVVEEDMYDFTNNLKDKKSLIYMGTLNYEDELICLIKTFAILREKYLDIKLNIIGGFVNNDLKSKIKNLISELNLTENIIWLGKIPASEIPNYLSKGGIMLLPRLAEEYSQAGFPIKLGEYLLSGSPTVVTKTGEIEDYLTDNVNAFLVNPNDYNQFASKIISIIENYEEALLVGTKGRELAIKKFGVKNICKVMLGC